MKIAVVKEFGLYETRVAASPETVKKIIALGASVIIEKGAGLASSWEDSVYVDVGATVAKNRKDAVKDADIVLSVQGETVTSLKDVAFKKGAILLGLLSPYAQPDLLKTYASQNMTTFALELVPRITRAQSMDVLSSQSNLAGYRAVLEASVQFTRAFPMMMTAAGTIAPAKVLVLGAGVAGLQAIATAKRLGAVVSAFDVRAAAKEQVESLGASFISVESDENAETKGGYAKEMSDAYKKRQADKIHESVKKSDIVISTALIPGKTAPVLVTADMVADMRYGSVIVDMAVEAGGNCAVSELGKVVDYKGVKVVGYSNLASRLGTDASALYARNVLNFLMLILDKESHVLKIDWADEIIKSTALTHEGKVVHPNFSKE